MGRGSSKAGGGGGNSSNSAKSLTTDEMIADIRNREMTGTERQVAYAKDILEGSIKSLDSTFEAVKEKEDKRLEKIANRTDEQKAKREAKDKQREAENKLPLDKENKEKYESYENGYKNARAYIGSVTDAKEVINRKNGLKNRNNEKDRGGLFFHKDILDRLLDWSNDVEYDPNSLFGKGYRKKSNHSVTF